MTNGIDGNACASFCFGKIFHDLVSLNRIAHYHLGGDGLYRICDYRNAQI